MRRCREGLLECLRRLVLPSLTLSVIYIALIARITRTSVLEVLTEDYIRTARAKGLSDVEVLLRHALRNAAVPIVTVIGIGVALLIGGVVVTESVFSIPGLGRLTVDAVLARDYPTVQAVILLFSFAYVLINLLVDSPTRCSIRGSATRRARNGHARPDPHRRCDRPRSPGHRAARGARPRVAAPRGLADVVVGAAILALIALMGVAAPLLTPLDPAAINPAFRNKLPGAEETVRRDDGSKSTVTHWMGTDSLGRDVYARVVYGARTSLTVGAAVAAISVALGLAIGLLSRATSAGSTPS